MMDLVDPACAVWDGVMASGGVMMENLEQPENTADDLFIQQPQNKSQHSTDIEMNECSLQAWHSSNSHASAFLT